MSYFVIFLLILNLGLMAVFFFITKYRFSKNQYLDNMRDEVSKLITDIQLQSETCIRLLEDKIKTANEAIKVAESRLDVIKNELKAKDKEVVVLDKLMSKNTKKAEETIKIYTDNPLLSKNNTTERVLNLYHEGFSATEISRQTGIALGEISLIISLDKK